MPLDLAKFAGELTIKVVKIEGFSNKAGFMDKTDPFVELTLGKEKKKTSVKDDAGGTVTFDEELKFNKNESDAVLKMKVLDKDVVSNDTMGKLEIDLATCPGNGWYEALHKGKGAGKVYLEFQQGTPAPAAAPKVPEPTPAAESSAKPPTRGGSAARMAASAEQKKTVPAAGTPASKPIPGIAAWAGELKVKVVKIEGFADKAGFMDKTDPFVKITLGKEKQKTSVKDNAGGSAAFNEVLTFMKAKEDKVLHVEVMDSDTMSNDSLGTVNVDLSAVGNGWHQTQHKNKDAGRVYLEFETGTPAPEKPIQQPGESKRTTPAASAPASKPIPGIAVWAGELKVKVVKIEGFADKAGFMDKTDPFVKITLGKEKQKTSVKDNAGGSVAFNEVLTFMKAKEDKVLHVEVMDSDTMSSDTLGTVNVDLSAVGNGWHQTQHKNKDAGRVYLEFETGTPAPEKPIQQPGESKRTTPAASAPASKPIPDIAVWAGELKVKVVKIEGFADKAGFMDKTDPFVKITLGQEKHKTSVKDNAGGSTAFNEVLTFLKAKEDKVLHVEVMDSDTMSNDSLGTVNVDLSVVGNGWHQTQHKNKDAGRVYLEFETGTPAPEKLPPQKAVTSLDLAALGGGKRLKLEVTVVSAHHMPKTDMFGKCDPFVRLEYGGMVYETQVIKSAYEALWNEQFSIELGAKMSPLKLSLLDWDRFKQADVIGEHLLSVSELSQLVQTTPLRTIMDIPPIRVEKDGVPVEGKDGQTCEVNLKFCIRESTMSFAGKPSPSSGQRQLDKPPLSPSTARTKSLMVKVIKGKNMPKMDSFGSCDPFTKVTLGNQSYSTEVKKGTYSPVWNQAFVFQLEGQPSAPLSITLYDWDRLKANEKIGQFDIPLSRIREVLLEEEGWESQIETAAFLHEDGKPVLGNGKKPCECEFQLGVVEGKQRRLSTSELDNEILRLRKRVAELEASNKQLEDEKRVMAKEFARAREYRASLRILFPQDKTKGQYWDLTLVVEKDAESEEMWVHCCILWARCEGLREDIEEARDTKRIDVHTVDLLADYIPGKPKPKETASAMAAAGQVADASDDFQGKEHDWNPRTCISIPGSVQGTPMRCSCAHGSAALMAEKGGLGRLGLDKKKQGAGQGGVTIAKGFMFKLKGVRPQVVRKVVEYLYGWDNPVFESEEVLEVILIAKRFHLKWLLMLLYEQGRFKAWGCSLWEAARVVDEADLGRTWLEELCEHAEWHLSMEQFKIDGGRMLSADGMGVLLRQDALGCEELLVFEAVMEWAEQKFKRDKAAQQARIAQRKLEAERRKEMGVEGREQEKAPREKEVTFAGTAEPFLRKVRYPFIPPEKLMSTVSKNQLFQQASVLDEATGMPLVLRAVFHQNGQRMDGWDSERLMWVPRAGSLMYNGEWEWMYGPAALTNRRWPVEPKYAAVDFCWATDDQITGLGLFKAEIENLDKDGDGEPSVHEILTTFMYYNPQSKTQHDDRGAHLKGMSNEILHHRKELTSGHRLGYQIMKTMGDQSAHRKLLNEKLWKNVKKVALSSKLFHAMREHEDGAVRDVFAVGRVRPSAKQSATKMMSDNTKTDSDPRLYGHAFVIFLNKQEAYDCKLRFDGRPFHKMEHADDGNIMWKSVQGETEVITLHLQGSRKGPTR